MIVYAQLYIYCARYSYTYTYTECNSCRNVIAPAGGSTASNAWKAARFGYIRKRKKPMTANTQYNISHEWRCSAFNICSKPVTNLKLLVH